MGVQIRLGLFQREHKRCGARGTTTVDAGDRARIRGGDIGNAVSATGVGAAKDVAVFCADGFGKFVVSVRVIDGFFRRRGIVKSHETDSHAETCFIGSRNGIGAVVIQYAEEGAFGDAQPAAVGRATRFRRCAESVDTFCSAAGGGVRRAAGIRSIREKTSVLAGCRIVNIAVVV